MKKRHLNKVCKSSKPPGIEAKATRCLTALLDGGIINRKTLGKMGVATYNDSAHPIISHLRNERFIPIESNLKSDKTADYSMLVGEITRYKDPILRKQQREEMKTIVEEKRRRKIIALLAKKKGGK